MSLHAKIHIGCKQLGIAEEDRRDLYERVTGKRSLTQMGPEAQKAVVGELSRLGFKPSHFGKRKKLAGKYAPKLQALWIAAWNLGLVRNRDDRALLGFVKRQSGLNHTRFLHHPGDAVKAIEALKGWMARETPVEWTFDKDFDPSWLQQDGGRIALAQWYILHHQDGPDCFEAFPDAVSKLVGKHLVSFTKADWIKVMNLLGEKVRAVKLG